jgi:hypothetical protein
LLPSRKEGAMSSLMNSLALAETGTVACPFCLAVIHDEITQDFEKASPIVFGDFGLRWIELRSMWDKNVTDLDRKQVEDARKILVEHKLRAADTRLGIPERSPNPGLGRITVIPTSRPLRYDEISFLLHWGG